MKFENIKCSFPLVQFDTDITYYSARTSTAIEWAILEGIKRLGELPQSKYHNYSIGAFYNEIFKIDNANLLLKPCLMNLADLNAIRTENIYDDTDLDNADEVTMDNLHLTEEGLKMQIQNQLPGEDQKKKESFLFNLSSGKISFTKGVNVSDNAEGLKIVDNDDFESMALPSAEIRSFLEKIQNTKDAPGWITKDTEIKNISYVSGTVKGSPKWSNKTLPVTLEDDFKVQVGNEKNVLVEKLYLSSLANDNSYYAGLTLPVSNINSVNQLSAVYRVGEFAEDLLADKADNDKIFFINTHLIDFDIKNFLDNSSPKVVILFYDENELSVENIGRSLLVKAPLFQITPNTLYGNLETTVYCGQFTIKGETTSTSVNLCYEATDVKEDLTKLIVDLVEKSFSQRNDLIYLLLAVGKDDLFYQTAERKMKSLNHLKEQVEYIQKLSKKSYSLFAKNTEKVLQDILLKIQPVRFNSEFESEDLTKVLSEVKENDLFKNEAKLTQEYISILFLSTGSSYAYQTLRNLLKQASGISRLMNGWVKTSIEVKNLYKDNILEEIVREYASLNIGEVAYSPFEEIIFEKRKCFDRLCNLLKDISLPYAQSEDSLRNLISHKRNISDIHDVCKKNAEINKRLNDYLKNRSAKIGSNISDISYFAETKFFEIEKSISLISDVAKQFANDPAWGYEKIYIVDTSALINHPELIDNFKDDKNALIIPKRVHQELDGISKDKNRPEFKDARKAIDKISTYRNKKVKWLISADSHVELLPNDYDPEISDNKILSIAIKYKARNPILLCDDKDFSNKTYFEHITVIRSEAFLKGE